LIARRVRELSVYSAITTPGKALEAARAQRPEAIVLSGGPRSVYAHDAPELDAKILELGLPVLGICYGLQWLPAAAGGSVEPAGASGGEYGRTEVAVEGDSVLFAGVPRATIAWMSHGDKIAKLPKGFTTLARSGPCPVAAAGDPARKLYGLQFHPEVQH